jgi:hypothetical protein
MDVEKEDEITPSISGNAKTQIRLRNVYN